MLGRMLQRTSSRTIWKGTTSTNRAYVLIWHKISTAIVQIVLGISFYFYFKGNTDLIAQLISGDHIQPFSTFLHRSARVTDC